MSNHIPTEVYLSFIDKTIEIHWDYHAWLMTAVWFGLVPFALMAVRYFKPKPTLYGIPKGTSKLSPKLIWWTIHFTCLYLALGLSLAGMLAAIVSNGGISGSTHSWWGLATITLAILQLVSAWFRGSHGGKHGANSNPNEPSTWRGDHYDMTPQRRWFEAYHKTAGYFTMVLAMGAVASGLAQYWMPIIAIYIVTVIVGTLLLAVWLERKGFRQDMYHSVYGNHPQHPFNKRRKLSKKCSSM
ncbi:MAG: hypothetical protein GY881_00725 [Gammaproteobacteria bacterium]|nr:hypothetical protein [Gammaproteobacteria bacterium]